ncbi:hypothetical protein [Polymorphospora lycopeni]|uniref:Uncharacterized protein n=1 Tax=Polymorphospora lycopeni TaxID=3140240 RepID=A0ABV5CKN5_9ACTN
MQPIELVWITPADLLVAFAFQVTLMLLVAAGVVWAVRSDGSEPVDVPGDLADEPEPAPVRPRSRRHVSPALCPRCSDDTTVDLTSAREAVHGG